MKPSVSQPKYILVAIDIASRIAKGEYKVGQYLYGHSLLASQYGVSPETIRRSINLLSEMNVVEVQPQKGTIIQSSDKARQYIDYFNKDKEMRDTYIQIRKLAKEYSRLNEELVSTIDSFFEHRVTLSAISEPFPNFQIVIPPDSFLIDKTIGETKFWEKTGCTIIAILRGGETILSPGPNKTFCANDRFIVIGKPENVETAVHLVQQRKKESHGEYTEPLEEPEIGA
ncbi:MAG: TrkA C-terminal domain-containing protein [Anaerovoracaceae bacterium]|jgi:K+/H+ antiporter YhaU regulatory subunit KhtT